MHGPQPHPVTPGGAATPVSEAIQIKRGGLKRGSYNCGRCGLPKKGHSCHLPKATTTPVATPSTDSASSVANPSPMSIIRPPPPPLPSHRPPCSNLRRALSFDDIDVKVAFDEDDEEEPEVKLDLDGSGKLPMSCLWEVLRRLPPPSLLAAARVCKGWRETTKRLWRAAEELRLRVPVMAQVGFVGSVLQKCPGLVKLSLRMERLGLKE